MTAADVKVLFGRRVRHLRKAKGVSQEAFAHEIKIDRSYFGSIERGERNVSLDNICLIADGLGVAPAELLTFDTLPDPESPPGTVEEPPAKGRSRGRSARPS
jgi:transcriptional regulator with XRE-family HTH domain